MWSKDLLWCTGWFPWQACSHGVLIKADLSYIDVSQNTPYLYLLQHPAGCAAYLEGGSINCVPRYHTQPLYTKRHDIKIFFFYLSFQFKQQFFYFKLAHQAYQRTFNANSIFLIRSCLEVCFSCLIRIFARKSQH